MRVLWITNIIFPAIAEKLNMPKVVVGGWMYSCAKRLVAANTSLKLAVATVYPGKDFITHQLDGIDYFLLPLNGADPTKYNKRLEQYWTLIKNDYTPHLVHIHGTEYPHGEAFLRSCPEVPAIASIQGLVSCYARYYFAGLTTCDILKSLTLRDIIRGTIWANQKELERQGYYEIRTINNLKHIIGRTSWDKAHALAINPDIKYHLCNETLRDGFYGKTWSYDECDKHSIFISQAGYPIKGLHPLLKAMPLILKQYPDTKIYVAGEDITMRQDGIKGRLLRTGYGSYISKLIKQYNLDDYVIFLGILNEEQMCQRYLRSNIFVCPSAIENSPNSLGEAQLLGVPCIASYVGGSMDMMAGNEENLYRFEEIEMLAMKICRIFSESRKPNIEIQRKAQLRHDGAANSVQLINIYKELLNDFNNKVSE